MSFPHQPSVLPSHHACPFLQTLLVLGNVLVRVRIVFPLYLNLLSCFALQLKMERIEKMMRVVKSLFFVCSLFLFFPLLSGFPCCLNPRGRSFVVFSCCCRCYRRCSSFLFLSFFLSVYLSLYFFLLFLPSRRKKKKKEKKENEGKDLFPLKLPLWGITFFGVWEFWLVMGRQYRGMALFLPKFVCGDTNE